MSYEGHEQHICKAGHRFDTGCRYEDDPPLCPFCREPSAWYNAVDDTNCDSRGLIRDWSLLLLTPSVVETCNLGHQHITKEATYRVPAKDEWTKLQCYYDSETESYLPLASVTETRYREPTEQEQTVILNVVSRAREIASDTGTYPGEVLATFSDEVRRLIVGAFGPCSFQPRSIPVGLGYDVEVTTEKVEDGEALRFEIRY